MMLSSQVLSSTFFVTLTIVFMTTTADTTGQSTLKNSSELNENASDWLKPDHVNPIQSASVIFIFDFQHCLSKILLQLSFRLVPINLSFYSISR